MELQCLTVLLILLHYSSGTEITTPVSGPFFPENSARLSWNMAHDQCLSVDKSLCVRKNLCGENGEYATSTAGVLTNEMWSPILDGYNDWLYIGEDLKYKCRKLSEIHGPPSWMDRNCSTIAKNDMGKEIASFCSAKSAFYCCDSKQGSFNDTLSPHEVPVYVNTREYNGENFYRYSKEKGITNQSWNVDQAPWRNAGRVPGDLAKFTLMSGFLKDKFENPIFFCVENIITELGLPTTVHMISTTWCSHPWRLNFFLYGSLNNNSLSTNRLFVNAVGNGAITHSRISLKEMKSTSHFVVYGPEGKTLLAPKFVDGCGSEKEILTSPSGVITSPNFPRKSKGEKKKVTCNWRITARKGHLIKITFKVLELSAAKRKSFIQLQPRRFQSDSNSAYNYNRKCVTDKLVVKNYGTLCGDKVPPKFFSVDNTLEISLQRQRGSKSIRFALVYEAIAPDNGLEKIQGNNQFTWNAAMKRCEASGKTLCSAEDICSVDGRPFYGVEEGDHWSPIINEYNDWVQVGRGNVHTCRRHNKVHGPPLWGIDTGKCLRSNNSHPCPKRNVVYCCDGPNSTLDAGKIVNIKILSTVQNGVVFFKYIREGVDTDDSFDSMKIWSQKRKFKGDFTSIKLHSKYKPGIGKAVYFCKRRIVPAIGKLKFAYSMFRQPCETLGWRLLYYMYSVNQRKKKTNMHYVGIYEKFPHHSRIHFKRFPTSFRSDSGYILFSYASPDSLLPDQLETASVNEACNGNTSVLVAPAILESPGYPAKYENDLLCKWELTMSKADIEKGNKLKLTIDELDLENPVDILVVTEVSPTTELVKSLDFGSKTTGRSREFTGQVSGVSLETSGSFLLALKTDSTVEGKGFKLKAEVIDKECGGEITESGQEITSPNYPLFYDGGLKCMWTVRSPSPDHEIKIVFNSFELSDKKGCLDSLQIDKGLADPLQFCERKDIPAKLVLNEPEVRVTFTTKTRMKPGTVKAGKGFSLSVYFELKATSKKALENRQCGVQTVPLDEGRDRIVKGLTAENGNFPWMVMIRKSDVVCGGSLLNERWVLSATHCFVYEYLKSIGLAVMQDTLDKYTVVAGRYKRNIPSPGEQHFNISVIYIREEYKRYRVRWDEPGTRVLGLFPYNDITLAKLATKAVFSSTVSPICLPTQDAHVGDFCYVAGWGSKDANKVDMVSELNYAKVPILDNSLCNSWKELEGTIMKNVICAGYPKGGRDHCWGDSGGPLMCRGRYGNFYVNGVVSWSRKCGGRRTPGIYARVWPFLGWINDMIKNM